MSFPRRLEGRFIADAVGGAPQEHVARWFPMPIYQTGPFWRQHPRWRISCVCLDAGDAPLED
jgi:hypothetical protein